MVSLYKDYLSTSWSAKSQDRWEGPFIIHQVLGKGTYHIKNYDTQDTKPRRVHGNRLKPYMLPKINWTEEHERIILTILDSETQELFQCQHC